MNPPMSGNGVVSTAGTIAFNIAMWDAWCKTLGPAHLESAGRIR